MLNIHTRLFLSGIIVSILNGFVRISGCLVKLQRKILQISPEG